MMGSFFPNDPTSTVTPRADKLSGGKEVAGRVLVMDDEETVLMVARSILERAGYRVYVAPSSSEALHLYQESLASRMLFDVVILDLTMPGEMNGLEVFEQMKQIDSSLRCLISSGNQYDPVVVDCRKLGFAGSVSKPYTIQSLIEAVQEAKTG